MPSNASREGFLDALRFFAALSVVLYHYGFLGYAPGNLLTLSFPELSPAARYGYLGVQLFFMISGYVILWSINGRTASQFALHRFIRLYPTFWLCAAITLLVEHVYPSGNLRLSAEDVSGNTQRHVLTQECADGEEPTFTFQAPGGYPSLVGRTSGGPA